MSITALIGSQARSAVGTLPEVLPDHNAVLIYTSGSTGNPKGALHTHRTFVAGSWNSSIPHELSEADRSLCVLPLYHVNAQNVTLLPTLLTGGSVVMPHRFVVRSFWDWIAEYRCTWSAIVPTIISQLLEWGDPRAEGKAEALERIRFMRSSSAPLAPSLHRAFEEKFGILLLEAMGSTECGGNIFANPLPPGKDKIGTPGRPYGFETRIVSPEGSVLSPGDTGEIQLRGPSVMTGYYKNPEGTSAVLDPEGWLRTGDLAYFDEDGYVFIVGRAKDLIIKGGMNIAPRQIDDVLISHPAVLDAAALGVPDHYLGEDIVAFVTLKSGVQANEQQILEFCESRLGSFKTPTDIYIVPDLPKGPMGKVQRPRLGEWFKEILQVYPRATAKDEQVDGHLEAEADSKSPPRDADRGDHRRDMGREAQDPGRECASEFLRSGRPLAAGDRDPLPAPQAVQRWVVHQRFFHEADRRPASRPCQRATGRRRGSSPAAHGRVDRQRPWSPAYGSRGPRWNPAPEAECGERPGGSSPQGPLPGLPPLARPGETLVPRTTAPRHGAYNEGDAARLRGKLDIGLLERRSTL